MRQQWCPHIFLVSYLLDQTAAGGREGLICLHLLYQHQQVGMRGRRAQVVRLLIQSAGCKPRQTSTPRFDLVSAQIPSHQLDIFFFSLSKVCCFISSIYIRLTVSTLRRVCERHRKRRKTMFQIPDTNKLKHVSVSLHCFSKACAPHEQFHPPLALWSREHPGQGHALVAVVETEQMAEAVPWWLEDPPPQAVFL